MSSAEPEGLSPVQSVMFSAITEMTYLHRHYSQHPEDFRPDIVEQQYEEYRRLLEEMAKGTEPVARLVDGVPVLAYEAIAELVHFASVALEAWALETGKDLETMWQLITRDWKPGLAAR